MNVRNLIKHNAKHTKKNENMSLLSGRSLKPLPVLIVLILLAYLFLYYCCCCCC